MNQSKICLLFLLVGVGPALGLDTPKTGPQSPLPLNQPPSLNAPPALNPVPVTTPPPALTAPPAPDSGPSINAPAAVPTPPAVNPANILTPHEAINPATGLPPPSEIKSSKTPKPTPTIKPIPTVKAAAVLNSTPVNSSTPTIKPSPVNDTNSAFTPPQGDSKPEIDSESSALNSAPLDNSHPTLNSTPRETVAAPKKVGEEGETAEPDESPMGRKITNYSRLAQLAAEKGNLELAESTYNKLLDLDVPDVEKKTALIQMAGVFEKNQIYSKAIAVYEKIVKLFPLDPKSPEILLKLGRIYRETGAYQMAISKFYSVLNTTLKIDRKDFESYKLLTQQAQFEIAETYFVADDYQQADKFFSLLKRLNLSREDKARVEFKSIYCHYILNDYPTVIISARKYIETYPETKEVPECRYVLASALRRMNRTQEATDEVLALLRNEKPKEKSDPKNWVYWQKKTGNQIANDLYQQTEFVKALTIYQALAKLDTAQEWQLPVVYQIGLCFERLRLLPRSLEAYHFITDECKKSQAAGGTLPNSIETLRQMAEWRSDQVAWLQSTDLQLQGLLGEKRKGPELSLPLPH